METRAQSFSFFSGQTNSAFPASSRNDFLIASFVLLSVFKFKFGINLFNLEAAWVDIAYFCLRGIQLRVQHHFSGRERKNI